MPETKGAEPVALFGTAAARRRWRLAGMVASGLLFAVAIVVLVFLVRELDATKVRAAFGAAGRGQILLALMFTAMSYTLLTGYDALALMQLGARVGYGVTALASFTSHAISFTLGFPVFTAGTVRFWVYSPAGLRPATIASLTIISGLTFWIGMSCVLAIGLLREATALAEINRLQVLANQALGGLILAIVAGYLVWVSLGRRSITVQGWTLTLPSLGVSLGQMLLGATDVCCAGAVLYVLAPPGLDLSYDTFIAIFVFATLLGMASHAPGGIGVFETTILLAVPAVMREAMLGSLLLFRLCYYVVPFVLALSLLGCREVLQRGRALRQAFSKDRAGAPDGR